MYTKDISVIIPHRDSLGFLPTLLSSIPNDDCIEIIIVDNSPQKISPNDILSEREIKLLYSSPSRGAGGARNVGIENANGKWLIFADADDYFTQDAFECFLSHINTDAELVYTCMGGIYLDTGEPADRGDGYTRLVKGYLSGLYTEEDLRLGFPSPCCKMVSHDLVRRNKITYDEIRAGNDIYFSTVSGQLAGKIAAADVITYIATVSHGTLTQRRDYEVIKARLYSKLHCNQFLKQHGHYYRQHSIMYELLQSLRFGPAKVFEFLRMVCSFRQNPFIGYRRWVKGIFLVRKIRKDNGKYITNKKV